MKKDEKSLLGVLFTAPQVTAEGIYQVLRRLQSSSAQSHFLLVVGVDPGATMPAFDAEWGETVILTRLTDETRTSEHVFQACVAWNELAMTAFANEADMVVFMGPDVEILDDAWYDMLLEEFSDLQKEMETPYGFGCVVLREKGAPGWPSFPVVTRKHLDIFGYVVPPCFVNQDFDPFVYRLYSDYGLVRFTKRCCVYNSVGGVAGGINTNKSEPNYERKYVEWRTDILQRHSQQLQSVYPSLKTYTTLTVATPVYRIGAEDISDTMMKLKSILNLEIPEKAVVTFTFIIDNPSALDKKDVKNGGKPSAREQLEALEQTTSRSLRIRVNASNVGASASRTRAWEECHTRHILFLDDDVDVDSKLLIAYTDGIRKHPHASGFVGMSRLTFAPSVGPAAVHFAQTSFFWHAAKNFKFEVPWGVTANICFRFAPGHAFDEAFPKTGGGEDIDFCIKLRDRLSASLLPLPQAEVTHPWWNEGAVAALVRRHYYWALGDGLLVMKHPQHVFFSLPNTVELVFLIALSFGFKSLASTLLLQDILVALIGIGIGDTIATVAYVHLNLGGQFDEVLSKYPEPMLAILLSGVVRRASETGQLVAKIRQGRLDLICQRFDWFTGQNASASSFQQHRDAFHFCLNVLCISAVFLLVNAFVTH